MAIKIKTNDFSTNEINIICVGTLLEGAVETKGRIRIDGKIKGIVRSSDEVIIGAGGEVVGDIYAKNAIIGGQIKGNIHVEQRLTLEATSSLEGNLSAGKLIIDDGAVFNGQSSMGGENSFNKRDFSKTTTLLEKELTGGDMVREAVE